MKKYGDWRGLTTMMANAPRRFKHNVDNEMSSFARKVQRSMIIGIRSKRFALTRNAASTIKAKGSSTPLIDKGDLIGSIKTHKIPDGYLVGANRNARNSKGKSLANIFAINTYGVDSVKKDGSVGGIPARDAITPAVLENEQEFKQAGKRALEKTFSM